MKRLIVNADDFGLHSAVNHGIIEGYEKGCIRSTSFVAAGAAAKEAAELSRKYSGLGVGIHLTLVAERPVLPPSEVPSLIGENGRLLPDHMAFIRRYKDSTTDSLACVAISGGASFRNLPNGRYVDAVTGDIQNVTNGTLTVPSIGKANMRVYVCCAAGFTGINGKIGGTSSYF